MIKFLPLDFLGVLYRIPRKNKNAVYRLQVSVLAPEIFKFEQEAISQKEIVFRFRKDILSLRKAGILISCA